MKVVLAVLLLVAAASAAPWGVLPYSGLGGVLPYAGGVLPYAGGVLPYTGLSHGLTYTAGSAIPIDGGYPYTDALGFSTGLQNAGARVPLTYAGAYHHLPISTTVVKAA